MKENNNSLVLKSMSEVLFKLQLDLEPIRDKALDEKARLTGYAQCAEQMIKIIASRSEELKKQYEQSLQNQTEEIKEDVVEIKEDVVEIKEDVVETKEVRIEAKTIAESKPVELKSTKKTKRK